MGIDIAVGILLLLGGLRGFRQGFANQVLILGGIVLAVIAADPASRTLEPIVIPQMNVVPQNVRGPLLFLGSMTAVCLAIWIVGATYLTWQRRKAFAGQPSLPDRFFGVAMGIVKSGFVAMVLIYAFNQIPGDPLAQFPPLKSQYEQSLSVSIANQQKLIDLLIETPEIRHIRENLAQLLRYYREQEATANKEAQSRAISR